MEDNYGKFNFIPGLGGYYKDALLNPLPKSYFHQQANKQASKHQVFEFIHIPSQVFNFPLYHFPQL